MKRINFRKPYKTLFGLSYPTWNILIVVLVTIASLVVIWAFQQYDTNMKISWVNEYLFNRSGRQISLLSNNNKSLEAQLEAIRAKYPNPTKTEIESYIKTIFGKDSSTAIAVSHHECGPTNKTYPKCQLNSQVEHSIGLFQINLYNSKQWVHASRIPGATMEAKIQWLENPFNNTLYAFWVYKTSGFNPWSSYTNKAYLADFK